MESKNSLNRKKHKGVITIYFSIIFLLIMSFIFALIDVTRVNVAKNQITIAADNAIESGMSNFDRSLYQKYGIFAIKDNSVNTNAIKSILNKNLTASDGGAKDYIDLLGLSNSSSEVTFVGNPFISNELMKEQICNAARYDATYSLFTTVLSKTGVLDKLQEIVKCSEDSVSENTVENLNSLVSACEKDIKKVEDAKSSLLKLALFSAYNDSNDENFPKYINQADISQISSLIETNPILGLATNCISAIYDIKVYYQNFLAYNNARFIFMNYSNEISEENNKLNEVVKSNKSTMDSAEKDINEKNDKIEKINKKIESLEDDIDDLKEEKSEAKDDAAKDAIQKEIDSKEDDIDDYKDDIKELENEKESIQSNIDTLNKENEEKNKTIKSNELAIKSITSATSNLETQANTMKSKYLTEITTFESTINDGLSAIDSLLQSKKRKKAWELINTLPEESLAYNRQEYKEKFQVYFDENYLVQSKTIFTVISNGLADAMYQVKNEIGGNISTIVNNINSKVYSTADCSGGNEIISFIQGLAEYEQSLIDSGQSFNRDAYVKDEVIKYVKSNASELINYGSKNEDWYNQYRNELKKIKPVDLEKVIPTSDENTWLILDIGIKVNGGDIFNDVLKVFKKFLGSGDGIIKQLTEKYSSTNSANPSQVGALPHSNIGIFEFSEMPKFQTIDGEEVDFYQAQANIEMLTEDSLVEFERLSDRNFATNFVENILNINLPASWTLEGLPGEVIDKLYLGEYVLNNFKSMVDPVSGRIPEETLNSTVLEYEIESMIQSNVKYSDLYNKTAVTGELIAFRMMCNGIFFAQNKDLQTQAKVLGAAVSMATKIIPASVATTLITAGWVYIESRKDVIDLLNGYEVPIIKKEETWLTQVNPDVWASLQHLVTQSSDRNDLAISGCTDIINSSSGVIASSGVENVVDSSEKIDEPNNYQDAKGVKFNYVDYLRFNLLIGSEDSIIDKVQDLVTLNMGSAFSYKDYAVEVKVKTDIGMKMWFSNSVFSNGNETHSFNTLERIRKYR